jgi:uncharacterized membrane protein YccF (DUF307 family)
MRMPRLSIVCPHCGQSNSPVAITCATCGATLVTSSTLGDPQANTVAGAPVPATPRELTGSIESARERLTNLAPELASLMAEVVSRRVTYQGRYLDLLERFRALPLSPPSRSVVVAPRRPNPPIPTRVIWFLFAGVWSTCLWVIATWLVLCLAVFGQLANRMITYIPTVLTLRTSDNPPHSIIPAPQSLVPRRDVPVRLAYTVLVGWWASLVWMLLAYAISLTVVGIPISYRMFSVAPAVAHLP